VNCKPNDLAIVVRGDPLVTELLGRICTTIYLAPAEHFDLPNGQAQQGNNSGDAAWVVEFANPINVPIGLDGKVIRWRLSSFAVLSDYALRPIRGDEEPQGAHTSTDKPSEVAA
jgi:hypothetical protein